MRIHIRVTLPPMRKNVDPKFCHNDSFPGTELHDAWLTPKSRGVREGGGKQRLGGPDSSNTIRALRIVNSIVHLCLYVVTMIIAISDDLYIAMVVVMMMLIGVIVIAYCCHCEAYDCYSVRY